MVHKSRTTTIMAGLVVMKKMRTAAIPDDPMTPGFQKGRPSVLPTPGRASFSGADGPDLLACGRKVDKVQIAYATRAKKVDVRKLKAQMWRDVEATPESDFAAVVNRVGAQQRQSDVTMPFYFICCSCTCATRRRWR